MKEATNRHNLRPNLICKLSLHSFCFLCKWISERTFLLIEGYYLKSEYIFQNMHSGIHMSTTHNYLLFKKKKKMHSLQSICKCFDLQMFVYIWNITLLFLSYDICN